MTCYLAAPAAMLLARNDGCSPRALGAFVFVYSLGNFWHYVSDGKKERLRREERVERDWWGKKREKKNAS